MGPCRMSYTLLVRRFRTSEMLRKWSPTSKLSDIKLSHSPDDRHIFFTCTRTCLSAMPIKLIFWYLQIFSFVYCDCIVYFADLVLSLRLPTFCITFATFLRTGICPDFTWIFIDCVSAGLFSDVFSPWRRKKRHQGKSLPKTFLQTQFKIIRSNSLSKENAIFPTSITASEKSNDS